MRKKEKESYFQNKERREKRKEKREKRKEKEKRKRKEKREKREERREKTNHRSPSSWLMPARISKSALQLKENNFQLQQVFFKKERKRREKREEREKREREGKGKRKPQKKYHLLFFSLQEETFSLLLQSILPKVIN